IIGGIIVQRFRWIVIFFGFIIIMGLSYNSKYNPFVNNNLDDLSFVDVSKVENVLYKEIEEKSELYNEDPQDAYIDKVWKKTPGRNGLKINLEKSYEQMKEKGEFKESLLVYDQISPNISLEELPPSPIFRGHPEKNMVAFLINVSWGSEYIPDILEVLKENNVKATFFIEGKWAKENAEYVKMIAEQDHIIGNHAYNHPDMARLSNQAILDQINKTNDVIKAITGKRPKWFAPPSGSFSEHVVDTADNLEMETIMWTVDTIDWKNPDVSVMINRVMDKLHPGATILMHPTSSVSKGLPQLIEEIEAKDYKIGTIEKLLSEER